MYKSRGELLSLAIKKRKQDNTERFRKKRRVYNSSSNKENDKVSSREHISSLSSIDESKFALVSRWILYKTIGNKRNFDVVESVSCATNYSDSQTDTHLNANDIDNVILSQAEHASHITNDANSELLRNICRDAVDILASYAEADNLIDNDVDIQKQAEIPNDEELVQENAAQNDIPSDHIVTDKGALTLIFL